jgi:hypothetical protein
MEVFSSGIANGLEAANIEFISENLKPIFCSPIALNFDNMIGKPRLHRPRESTGELR